MSLGPVATAADVYFGVRPWIVSCNRMTEQMTNTLFDGQFRASSNAVHSPWKISSQSLIHFAKDELKVKQYTAMIDVLINNETSTPESWVVLSASQ